MTGSGRTMSRPLKDAKRDATAYPLVAGARGSGVRSAPNRRWSR